MGVGLLGIIDYARMYLGSLSSVSVLGNCLLVCFFSDFWGDLLMINQSTLWIYSFKPMLIYKWPSIKQALETRKNWALPSAMMYMLHINNISFRCKIQRGNHSIHYTNTKTSPKDKCTFIISIRPFLYILNRPYFPVEFAFTDSIL